MKPKAKTLSEFLGYEPDGPSATLSPEKRQALWDAMRSDADKVIEYLEEEKMQGAKAARINRIIAVLTAVVGVLTLIATVVFGVLAISA